jgi:hypothetical protein
VESKTPRQSYIEMLERMLASCERMDAMGKGRLSPKQYADCLASTAAIRVKLEKACTDTDPDENPASVQLAGWMGAR